MNDITFLTRQKSLTRNDQDMTAARWSVISLF